MRKALLAGVWLCVWAPAPATAQTTIVLEEGRAAIQPGMFIENGESSCTANFVYDGVGLQAGKHYLGTAAHCVDDRIGSRVTDRAGVEFGTVAFSAWPYTNYAEDYAFIEIDRAAYPRVDPALAGHPGVPTGLLPAQGGAPGDQLFFSGWGFATVYNATTREQRPAVLKNNTDRLWFAEGVVSNTDSGGPVVHGPTGGALGSVSNYCVPLPVNHSEGFEPGCISWGPNIAHVLESAAAKGFTVKVRSAEMGPPKVPAQDPGPAVAAPPAGAAPAPASQPSAPGAGSSKPAAKKPAVKCKRRRGESRKRAERRCRRAAARRRAARG